MEYGPPGEKPQYSEQPAYSEQPPTEQPPMGQAPSDQYPYSRPSSDDLVRRSYPRGRSGIYRFIATEKIVLFVIIGVFLIFLGSIFIAAVAVPGPPEEFEAKYDDDDDGNVDGDKWDNWIEDNRNYEFVKDIFITLGVICILLGMMGIALPLIGGGVGNTEIDKNVRIGMLISAGLIIFAQVALIQTMMSSANIYSLFM
jgi:hypothetical protein